MRVRITQAGRLIAALELASGPPLTKRGGDELIRTNESPWPECPEREGA
jgi:hypothetical protein